MSFPNPWDAPEFYQTVKIGGRPIKANLVEIDGISVEDDWTVQRPLGSSGATNVFKGTKPAGPCKLTFEAVTAEEFDDLRELFEMMRPKPGMGAAGTGSTVGSPGSAAYGKGYVNQSSNSNPAPTMTADDLLKSAKAALAAERAQRLVVQVEGGLAVVSDPLLLGRVVANLVDNACKFLPAGGAVQVQARREGTQLVIEVIDDGNSPVDVCRRTTGEVNPP